MSYYWFNREEVLQKAGEKYHNYGGKEKAAEYYQKNKDVLKEKARNKYTNLSEKAKEAKRQYSRDRYKKIKEKFGGEGYVIKVSYYWFNREKLLKNA